MGYPETVQSTSLAEIDGEVLQELMKLAGERLIERKKVEKEIHDAAIAECKATITNLDPKIAKLDVKIAKLSGAITEMTHKRAECAAHMDRADRDLAEAIYNCNQLGKMEADDARNTAQIESIKLALDCLEYIENTVGDCEVYTRKYTELQRFYKLWDLTADSDKEQLVDKSEFCQEFKKLQRNAPGIQIHLFLSRVRKELCHFPPEKRNKVALGKKLERRMQKREINAKDLGALNSAAILPEYMRLCWVRDNALFDYGYARLDLEALRFEHDSACKIRDKLIQWRKDAVFGLDKLMTEGK